MHNKKVSFSPLVSVLIILLWLSACSQSQQEELVISTETNNIFPTPQILPAATSTVGRPQLIFTKTLTSTPQPKIICPVLNSKTTISGGKTYYEIEQAILDYLNQGGSPERLPIEIKKLQQTSIVDPSQVFTTDTNGDGIKEIVLALNFGPPVSGDYMGDVHIYSCVDGKYNDATMVEGIFAETLKILAVENLLGSDTPDILIFRRWAYQDIYHQYVELWILTAERWAIAFKSPDSHCGIQSELKTGTEGRKELVIIASNRCSNDTDASLTSTKWTYVFEENEVKLLQEESFPSP
jgi:hypothetical protein